MPAVDLTAFVLRYEHEIPAEDHERIETLLEDACALAEGLLETTFTASDDEEEVEEMPGIVRMIICGAVRRAYENPNNYQGETVGDYSWRVAYSDVTTSAMIGVYFTPKEEKMMLRAMSKLSARSVGLTVSSPFTAWPVS